jgi:serine/threonine protein kinase
MLDIAEGLKYLHTFSPCIIHADLKGVSLHILCIVIISHASPKVNILISQSHRACLADFGLATAKDTMSLTLTSSTTTRTTGTLRWQAPELLDPDLDEYKCNNSIASDIYAYACVCYEVRYPAVQADSLFEHMADIFWSITFPRHQE